MTFIREIFLSPEQEEHIWTKHRVDRSEVEEVIWAHRVSRRGRDSCEEIYGQTQAGRYLVVFLYPRGQGDYDVATARPMETVERRYYLSRKR